jgi:ferritin
VFVLAERIEAALNRQLAMELRSAYVYLSMSAYCESQSLPGFARWLRLQSKEEVEHAMKFFDFINDREGSVRLETLEEPAHDFSSPLEVFRQALEHERAVSRAISDLYSAVVDERDYASQAWLDWFATEQVEEEKSVGHIVGALERIGDRGDALFFLDKELADRA